MPRLLARILPASLPLLAQAQTSPTEATVQPASELTVVVFLVIFVGSIVGFIAYSMWLGKKKKERGEE